MTALLGTHPLPAALAAAEQSLDEAIEGACWSLGDDELRTLVDRTHRVAARVEELRLRAIAEAERRDLRTASGAATTAAWLAASQRTSRRAAGRDVHLGADLDKRFARVRVALGSGGMNGEQAQVICLGLRRLPADLPAGVLDDAESRLVEAAMRFGPEDLQRLVNRVLELVAPDQAAAHEARVLERQERDARASARLWLRPQGDGRTRGGFCIPDAQAAMLQTALDALISPRRPAPLPSAGQDDQTGSVRQPGDVGTDDEPVGPDLDAERLPYEQRLGLAFAELVEHLPVGELPDAGRATAVVTVTLQHSELASGIGAATLSNGERMSASQARRLVCTARLLPVVLGGESEVLDLGRSRRYFSWAQRIALGVRQGGCIADGCWRPPAQCEAHHCVPWSSGGDSDLGNGALLCSFHHHLVHDSGWDCRVAPDGIPELVPPRSIDPQRRPTRHRRFRRRAVE